MSRLTIREVLEKHKNRLEAIEGVVGVGLGTDKGQAVIQIAITDGNTKKELPRRLNGYRVIFSYAGKFRDLTDVEIEDYIRHFSMEGKGMVK